ncbi:MAG: amidophosphoribosyltransferase [Oligoflexia bacterium]|nr:amidophosphoribosyltransferase [Oligoflexia bacterium]
MCGVVGVINTKDYSEELASYATYKALLNLQHRGQDAAGIVSFNENKQKFKTYKNLGLISKVFKAENFEKLLGKSSLGHNRYATVGSDGVEDLQPIVQGYPSGMAMAHNGNLVNYHSLVDKLNYEEGIQFLTSNDLEILICLMEKGLMGMSPRPSSSECFNYLTVGAKKIFNEALGSFSLVGLLANGGLFAMRDPNGLKPLVLGKKIDEAGNESFMFCSETIALDFTGYEYVRDVNPGELVFIDNEGTLRSYQFENSKRKNCMFEWVYFSAAESTIENRSVYNVRLNLGNMLAKKLRPLITNGEISPDYVCPVPDTSRTSSISLAENLGLPYREGLIKNRYVQRSFILNSQTKREKALELKLSPVRSQIEGKSILLVDDSLVRGTTSKKIIQLLKKNGAKDVTLAIACPPLRYGCYYGIDFPSREELMANGRSVEEIAEFVGANRVIYLDEQDLKEAINSNELCMACVNNNYPTITDDAENFINKRDELREELS